MQAYLKQFSLTMINQIRMESFIYSIADQTIEEYNGGRWNTFKFGGLSVLKIPTDAKTLTITSPISGRSVTTDIKTASLIITFLVTSWFWEKVAETISEESFDSFSDYLYALRNAVFLNGSGIDTQSFYKVTD